MKTCAKCRASKELNEFHRSSQNKDGRHPWCRACKLADQHARYHATPLVFRERRRVYTSTHPERVRDTKLRGTYGISLEHYTLLLSRQGGGCAICGTDTPGGQGAFHVDHDHACCPGKRSCGECVRGLLCNKCNSALGYLKDDPRLLRRASLYLEGQLAVPERKVLER